MQPAANKTISAAARIVVFSMKNSFIAALLAWKLAHIELCRFLKYRIFSEKRLAKFAYLCFGSQPYRRPEHTAAQRACGRYIEHFTIKMP